MSGHEELPIDWDQFVANVHTLADALTAVAVRIVEVMGSMGATLAAVLPPAPGYSKVRIPALGDLEASTWRYYRTVEGGPIEVSIDEYIAAIAATFPTSEGQEQ